MSFTSPHSAVGSQTVSRWIRTVLSNAGIDAQYTGPSTRAAATSMAADSGVPLEDIIAAELVISNNLQKLLSQAYPKE